MDAIDEMRVVTYTEERIPNPYPKGSLPWQVYHKVRNAIVRTCRCHGPTGPMGICPISRWQRAPNIFKWERGDPDPVYYIIDDQYNDERYLYAELLSPDAFRPAWLTDIATTLEKHAGWGLGVSDLPGHYVLVFSDKLMVTGPRLSSCKTAGQVVEEVQRLYRQAGQR
jgi:hypothetical protein